MKNKRITGERWKECDVCGFDYPLSHLRRVNGLWRCIEHCYDEVGRDYYLSKLIVRGEDRGADQEIGKENITRID